jgi:cobalt/nickel transport system permease protein
VAHTLLNPYQHRGSALHRAPPGAKLAGAVGIVLLVVALPRGAWFALLTAFLLPLAAALASRVALGALFRRLLLVEPVALGMAALALFQPDGASLFATMLAKSTICLFTMIVLAATTRFTDILGVLDRLRIPALLTTTLALMHRYLALLFEEMHTLRRARKSRTFRPGRAPLWQSGSSVIAHLFVRVSERSERVYAAMCARGWKT